MINTDTKNKIRNSIVIGLIAIIILLTQLFIWNHSKVNATGFDYTINNSYGSTNAQLKTEDEYYYNQIDNEFSYYQLNFNKVNLNNQSGNNCGVTWSINDYSINLNGNQITSNCLIYSYDININGSNNWYINYYYVNGTLRNYYSNGTPLRIMLYNNNSSSDNLNLGINSNNYTNIVSNNTTFNNTNSMKLVIYTPSFTGSYSGVEYANLNFKLLITNTATINENTNYIEPTGLNNGYNVNFYGRLYDIKPNTQYTLFTGSSGNDLNSMSNVYLSKNCISANILQCQFNYEISDITYNENNGSYTFLTPNYNDFKGVYYLVSDKANNAHFPTISGNMALYEGILDKNKSYYTNLEQNYFIQIKIENIQKQITDNYLFNGRNIYNSATNVGLIKFNLTKYTIEGTGSTYKYYMLCNESYTNPGYYTYNIPNLFDLNLDNLGNIKGSIPSIEFENYTDWNSSSLASHHPTLSANWITKNQYMSNVIGFVGNNVYKGFYPGYGYGINNVDFNQNFEFTNKGFRWDQFTSNIYRDGNNNNQLGFWFLSIATRNTIFDNNTLTPPDQSGFGNSDYETYNACDGNIIEDFGCHLGNGLTYVIFHLPIIGPVIGFIVDLVMLMYNLVTALKWYENLGILFGIFVLIMFLKILSILWKGKDE